jgi:hypothetical protein
MEIGELSKPPIPRAEAKPTPSVLAARWRTTPIKCGDEVVLEAETENVEAGTDATFHVKKLSDGAEVASGTGKVTGNAASHTWQSKKPSSDWPAGHELGLSVDAAGVTHQGGEAAFHHYPPIAHQTRVHHRNPVGFRAFDGRYTIEFTEKRQLTVVVRVKLINKQGARPAREADYGTVANGPAVADADKATMKAAIQKILSKRLDLHRKGCKREDGCDCPRENTCCKLEVVVKVRFVEDHAHHTVNLWPGSARADCENWHVVESRPGLSWAHEVGHLLGWYDEYPGGAHAPPADNANGRWLADRPRGIMGPGSIVYWDHLEDIRYWFVGKTGEQWRLINR